MSEYIASHSIQGWLNIGITGTLVNNSHIVDLFSVFLKLNTTLNTVHMPKLAAGSWPLEI